jgi:hypothetical protein
MAHEGKPQRCQIISMFRELPKRGSARMSTRHEHDYFSWPIDKRRRGRFLLFFLPLFVRGGLRRVAARGEISATATTS